MPAFLGKERRVLIRHRASFIPKNTWSSGVAAFVSNAELPGARCGERFYNKI